MAAKYRKIDPRIWSDEKFQMLDGDGKLLVFWLLSSSRVNRCGIVLYSPGLASEETGIDRHRVDTVCDTVCRTMKWECDKGAKLVFLTRWWKYNAPPNKDALIGALSDLEDVPRNNLKRYLQAAKVDLKPELHATYDTVLDTVYRTVSYTVFPQEQEQEQEENAAVAASSPSAPSSPSKAADGTAAKPPKPKREPSGDHQTAIAYFCDSWKNVYGSDYPFSAAAAKNAKLIQTILESCGNLDRFKQAVDKFFNSRTEFLTGRKHQLQFLQSGLAEYLAGEPAPANHRPAKSLDEILNSSERAWL